MMLYIRIGDGIPDTGLGRQIHHHIKIVFGESFFNQRFIRKIALDEGPLGIGILCGEFFNFRQTPFLDGYIVVVIYIVKPDDVDVLCRF